MKSKPTREGLDDTKGEPPATDALWANSHATAAGLGCSYPQEPSGTAVRLILGDKRCHNETIVRQLTFEMVRACDACYGRCTVPPVLKCP